MIDSALIWTNWSIHTSPLLRILVQGWLGDFYPSDSINN